MKTSYQGKEHHFNNFDELWCFYQKILSGQLSK